jgi:hypothetical protein
LQVLEKRILLEEEQVPLEARWQARAGGTTTSLFNEYDPEADPSAYEPMAG